MDPLDREVLTPRDLGLLGASRRLGCLAGPSTPDSGAHCSMRVHLLGSKGVRALDSKRPGEQSSNAEKR